MACTKQCIVREIIQKKSSITEQLVTSDTRDAHSSAAWQQRGCNLHENTTVAYPHICYMLFDPTKLFNIFKMSKECSCSSHGKLQYGRNAAAYDKVSHNVQFVTQEWVVYGCVIGSRCLFIIIAFFFFCAVICDAKSPLKNFNRKL